MSPTLEPSFCESCHDKLEPDEIVVQGIQTVGATMFGDEGPQTVEGPTAIFHDRHWPPDEDGWRQTYRGPLSGLRPNET